MNLYYSAGRLKSLVGHRPCLTHGRLTLRPPSPNRWPCTPTAYKIPGVSSLLTIAETASWIPQAARIFSEEEVFEIITFLATEPTAGDLIPGTGGVRKLRWGVEGRGKRGGARIIYYFHSDRMPLYLLAVFTKNERADLSPSERATLRSLVDQLVAAWNL